MKDIEIRGEHIVHGIYIIVIVILAVALVFKTTDSNNGISDEGNDAQIDSESLKDASIMIIKNTNTPTTSTVTVPTSSSTTTTSDPAAGENTTQNSTQTDDVPEEDLLPITGNIELVLDKITKEVKGEDWAKITKIEYTVKNQKPVNFYPKILAYLWDEDDEIDIRNYVEEEIFLEKIKPGEMMVKATEISISFNDINKEKTLKLVLYDENDELLDTVIKKFTI